MQDQEDAVERERSAAASRLREACERYEQQMQVQRLRLVSDADLKLEAAEAARKEDRRRAESEREALLEQQRVKEQQLKDEFMR